MKKTGNKDGITNLPLKVYVEHFLKKYKILTSFDLSILISEVLKSDIPFNTLKVSISRILNSLKKDGRVVKVKPMKWQLVEDNET